MLTNDREREICNKYSKQDETGHVHCCDCPLVRPSPYSDLSCKATAHYDRHLREWVPDEAADKNT